MKNELETQITYDLLYQEPAVFTLIKILLTYKESIAITENSLELSFGKDSKKFIDDFCNLLSYLSINPIKASFFEDKNYWNISFESCSGAVISLFTSYAKYLDI